MSKKLEFVDVTEQLTKAKEQELETLRLLLLKAEQMHAQSLEQARDYAAAARDDDLDSRREKLLAIAKGARRTARQMRRRTAALRDIIAWREQSND